MDRQVQNEGPASLEASSRCGLKV